MPKKGQKDMLGGSGPTQRRGGPELMEAEVFGQLYEEYWLKFLANLHFSEKLRVQHCPTYQ